MVSLTDHQYFQEFEKKFNSGDSHETLELAIIVKILMSQKVSLIYMIIFSLYFDKLSVFYFLIFPI